LVWFETVSSFCSQGAPKTPLLAAPCDSVLRCRGNHFVSIPPTGRFSSPGSPTQYRPNRFTVNVTGGGREWGKEASLPHNSGYRRESELWASSRVVKTCKAFWSATSAWSAHSNPRSWANYVRSTAITQACLALTPKSACRPARRSGLKPKSDALIGAIRNDI